MPRSILTKVHARWHSIVAEEDGLPGQSGIFWCKGLVMRTAKNRDVFRWASLASLRIAAIFRQNFPCDKGSHHQRQQNSNPSMQNRKLAWSCWSYKIGQDLPQNNIVDEANKSKHIVDVEWMYRVNKIAMKFKSKGDMKNNHSIPLADDLKKVVIRFLYA